MTPYRPRTYLPDQIDLADTAVLGGIYDQLTEELQASQSVPQLETWLDHYGEVTDAIDQIFQERHVATSLQTDDPARSEAENQFIKHVIPWRKPRDAALQRQLAAHPFFEQLPPYYDVFRRNLKNSLSLFQKENVPREEALAGLIQQYTELSGGMEVDFEGKRYNLPQLKKIELENDRSRRQQAWEQGSACLLQNRKALDDLFDSMLKLRHAIAKEAGCDNYRDYMFRAMEHFDYTPEDCFRFHDAVEKEVLPLIRLMNEERSRKMGIEKLQPWDFLVDPQGRAPLAPFQTAGELFDKTAAVLGRVDPRLRTSFEKLRETAAVDLEARKGKAPGGEQFYFPESRTPFILMNAVGTPRDVDVLGHEGGHSIHAYQMAGQRLSAYRGNPPLEFAEVASTSLELFGSLHLQEFYPPAEAERAKRMTWEACIRSLPSIAAGDAFQHWVYTHPDHTHEERDQAWEGLAKRFGVLTLLDRFSGDADWGGHTEARKAGWQSSLHFFECPFYFLQYGYAKDGAMQLFQNAQKDLPGTVSAYLHALELGASQPLPQLFAAAGIRFDPRGELLGSLMGLAKKELGLETAPVPRQELSGHAFVRRPGEMPLAESAHSIEKAP